MHDHMHSIFGNPVSPGVIKKARQTRLKYLREFGDDSAHPFHLALQDIPALNGLGVQNLDVQPGAGPGFDLRADSKALVVGNIRMGFGHYRISMAIASAARHRGFNPYWFDLHSYQETSGGKIIAHLNGLYSKGSRLSQQSRLFNRFFWEPLNSEGFRQLSYNAVDNEVARAMVTPCCLLPPDVPFVATHVWPAQAAVHAGLNHVVNVIPDNWPMALHLAPGAIHCVQSPSAWLGYKTLRGMDKGRILKPMPPGELACTGHYIDHEIVSHLESDTMARLDRLRKGKPLGILLSVGGAGAQQPLFVALIRSLLPRVQQGKVVLFINVGDHAGVLGALQDQIPELARAELHQDDWEGTKKLARATLEPDQSAQVQGIHIFHHRDIFAAVYATNLLMRASDLLLTKPSELAFYPVPKLHLKRVGGHEAWGAIRSAELGDGSVECSTIPETLAMLDLLLDDPEPLALMNQGILSAHRAGAYDGAYKVVDLAIASKESASDQRKKHKANQKEILP